MNTPAKNNLQSKSTNKDLEQSDKESGTQHILSKDTLMCWSTKSIKPPQKDVLKTQLLLIISATFLCAGITFITWESLTVTIPNLMFEYLFVYAITGYLIAISRQKTVFTYRISKEFGELEHYLYFPNFSAPLFKALAVSALLFFIVAALYTGSLLFLIGPCAIALGAAKILFSWKNEVTVERSLPWSEYNFLTIDNKRMIIVTHKTNQTVGFEARFPNKRLLEQYLHTIKTLVPETAVYTEKIGNGKHQPC